MAKSPPQYQNDLSGFIGDLRSLLFSSQNKAAQYFHVSRPTISRYESGLHLPPLGYLTCLVRLLVDRQDAATALTYRATLLQEINRVIPNNYLDESFRDWAELDAVAGEYLARQQALDVSGHPEQQNIPAPAEVPLPPHFYVERPQLQQALLDKIKHERVHTLVLHGSGGVGKSSLASWLARITRADFKQGQVWIQLSENLEPEEIIADAQTQLARRFGVVLSGTSLAERAGQLRTLLSDKQCFVILDSVWTTSGLVHLQVVNDRSGLLVTTRYRKVADVLEAPVVHIDGMTIEEGLTLLTKWAEHPVTAVALVERLGGLPLALKLSGVQLRDDSTPAELLSYFQQHDMVLNRLDLDDPQDDTDSLYPCFERSFNPLNREEQEYFMQLSCFSGRFEIKAVAKVWGLDFDEARRVLWHLYNLALVEHEEDRYQLHPLLRDYARQKLSTFPAISQLMYRRHAVYYLRNYLDHPQVLSQVTEEPPGLDESWSDIVAGVKWLAVNAPQLAAIATLLAHTERLALAKALGSSLIESIETYLTQLTYAGESAILSELAGDLHLFLNFNLEAALIRFETASQFWVTSGNILANCQAQVRVASIYLLNQNYEKAAQVIRQAQSLLEPILPISEASLDEGNRLFYWFNIVYSVLVQWPELPEKDVQAFADLAQQTQQFSLVARGYHVYRLWATEPQRLKNSKIKGRSLAAKAAWLWRCSQKRDQALAEIMWTQEATSGRRRRWLAKAFAQRRARMTPILSQEQLKMITDEQLKFWLTANEEERITWLVENLPPPGTEDWGSLEDILDIGILGREVRYLIRGMPRPDDQPMDKTIWRVLAGQKVLPLAGKIAAALVTDYRAILDAELS